MYIYPKDLLSYLEDKWSNPPLYLQNRYKPLPPIEILNSLIEVTYHTSFMTEELRGIKFRIAYCSKEEITNWLDKRDTVYLIEFNKRRNFNISELLRLSPATDPSKVLICIDSESEDNLFIWGLLDLGASWSNFATGNSSGGQVPPDALTISSQGPGNLSISRSGIILLNLVGGMIVEPIDNVFYKGPISNFFTNSYRDLVAQTNNELDTDKYDKNKDNLPILNYTRFLQRILFKIQEMRHGGTIIVVPDDITLDDERMVHKIKVKYPCNVHKAWNLLIKSLVLHKKYYKLHFSLWDRKKETIKNAEYRDVSTLASDIETNDDTISDMIDFISRLAGVDGSIVMTDKLRLLGFGAEVITLPQELESVQIANDAFGSDNQHIPIESFGTRHRSAFRLCYSYEDAVCFVISQDGGLKAVKKQEENLIVWNNINSSIFGI